MKRGPVPVFANDGSESKLDSRINVEQIELVEFLLPFSPELFRYPSVPY